MRLAKTEFSQNGGARNNGATPKRRMPAQVEARLRELANKSGDPELWIQKYNFYVDKLELVEEQATHWASNAVSASMEARVELALARDLRRVAA